MEHENRLRHLEAALKNSQRESINTKINLIGLKTDLSNQGISITELNNKIKKAIKFKQKMLV